MGKNQRSVSVSEATGDRIDAYCKRTGDTQAELVDRAVLPMLDAVAPVAVGPPPSVSNDRPETFREFKRQQKAKAKSKKRDDAERVHPSGEYCRSCINDCGGQPYREMDHRGAMVPVCIRCSDEPVRERDHLFGGGRPGIGDGNKRRSTNR